MILRDIVGGLVTLMVSGLFLAAWRYSRQDRESLCLVLIVVAGFLLRAFLASDLFLHEWDERYHALVAKHLALHLWKPTLYEDPLLPYDYRSWTSNHIWLHKEPLALWLMAISMKVLGFNEIALRLPSLLFASASIVMTYFIARAVGGTSVAFIAAGLHAIHGKLIELSSGRTASDHVDTLFIALVAIGGWIAVRYRRGNVWCSAGAVGLLSGMAALAKSPLSTLVIVLWWSLLQRESTQRPIVLMGGAALAFVVTACVYLPWHIYIANAYPAEATWERAYTFRHITEVLEGHGGGLLYHFKQISRLYGEIALLSIIWFFYRGRQEYRDGFKIMLALWIGVPYVVFTAARTKMPAYVMLAAPAVFTVLSCHFWELRDAASRIQGWRRGVCVIGAVLLLVLPVRYSLERLKPMWGPDWSTQWAYSLRDLGEQCRGSRTVVFKVARPIELMFYSTAIAYPHVPSEEELIRIAQNGYRVCVLDDGSLPSWVRGHAMIDVLPQQGRGM